jgi:nicotinamide-nucleotide amidase
LLVLRLKSALMKKASIVIIGNEVVSGQIIDTNTSFLAQELLSLGISVVSTYCVPDDIKAIAKKLRLATIDADIIIATGGLGPTDDDLTRQGFAEFLGAKLELQAELLQRIERFFAARNRKMPARNKVQACIPNGAKVIENTLGTAPGFKAEHRGKLLYALPGVPSEMKQMCQDYVMPELEQLTDGQAIVIRKLRCFGAGESDIAEMLGPIMGRSRNPLINCTAGHGVITLSIVATAQSEAEARKLVGQDEESLRRILGDLVFGTDDQTLAEIVGLKLAEQRKTVAVAESCTGGMLAKLITDIPGASRYFTYGWITYSNQAKTAELGVPTELIERYGAVSEQVAVAMAEGARRKAGADFAIAITGIAGPTGASEQKPVGLVYISVGSDNNCETMRYIFSSSREFVRLRAAYTALNMLRLKL